MVSGLNDLLLCQVHALGEKTHYRQKTREKEKTR